MFMKLDFIDTNSAYVDAIDISIKHTASVSHHEATIAELRADWAFAVEYLKVGDNLWRIL